MLEPEASDAEPDLTSAPPELVRIVTALARQAAAEDYRKIREALRIAAAHHEGEWDDEAKRRALAKLGFFI